MAGIRRVFLVFVLVASILASSCSSPQPTPTAPPVGQTPISAAPEASATPIPPPATVEPPTATPLPPTATPLPPTATAVKERQAKIDALYVRTGDRISGGTSRVKVTVEKNPSSELRVGFYEEEVGGTGPQWRAAGWMAVILSSFLLGVDPMDYRFTYDVGGYIDGPSAGALMTVATLSCLLGDELKPDSTMTGIINPDGTIGPVGGIPHKVDGAAAQGKKLVLIPAGQRNDIDLESGQSVDVIERGRRAGVTVKEVTDIYEAYQLLTGKALPRSEAARDARPELPGSSFDRVKAKAKEWYTRYWKFRGEYDALKADVKMDFTDEMMSSADEQGQRSSSYYDQGMATGAYGAAVGAAMRSAVAFHTAKVVEAYLLGGGEESAIRYVDSLSSVGLRVDAILDRLQAQPAETLGDVAALADAYGQTTVAMGLTGLGNSVMQEEYPNASGDAEKAAALAKAALYFAMADHALQLAEDSMEIGIGYGSLPAPDEAKVKSMSELLRKAAEANINYFDAVVLDDVARNVGAHPDLVRAQFAGQDFDYMFAISTLNALPAIQEKAGPGAAGLYATLGAALSSYTLSSTLISKYYSLGGQIDDNGNLVGVSNERAMIDMLDFAERHARENIALATSLGIEPVQPVVHYESGKIDREGSLEDKFGALQSFWTASMQGQILGTLSGKVTLVKE